MYSECVFVALVIQLPMRMRQIVKIVICGMSGSISRSFLLRMRNVSDKSCRENQNTHFVFSNVFIFENRTVYEIMWKKKKLVERGRPQMKIRRWRIACCVTKAMNTHTQFV
jgi:hypothetical protein